MLASGHTLSIQSCCWSPSGLYLATVSLDKTTRIWSKRQEEWHEIARPQIHGYEMQAISVLDDQHFLSAGDEKILRSFEAPFSFVHRLSLFQNLHQELSREATTSVLVPALGLSNKTGSECQRLEAPLDEPPTEFDLGHRTLWLETDKLYGHGLEVRCLAVTKCGELAASASKATTAEDAAVRFWRRNKNDTWRALGCVLSAHTLTVVRMVFSPDGQYLLSVSRDRRWSLISVNKEAETFALISTVEAHARIIWCADWSYDASFFVTASRDRILKTWKCGPTSWIELAEQRLEFPHAVTAVSIHRNPAHQNLMVVGLEDGSISIFQFEQAWSRRTDLSANLDNAPSAVSDLSWHPRELTFAAVSSVLQIFTIDDGNK